MARTRELTAIFHGATREKNSRNGNPTWLLRTSEGNFLTGVDSAVGIEVPNAIHSEFGMIGKHVVFSVTGRLDERVYAMRLADDTEIAAAEETAR